MQTLIVFCSFFLGEESQNLSFFLLTFFSFAFLHQMQNIAYLFGVEGNRIVEVIESQFNIAI